MFCPFVAASDVRLLPKRQLRSDLQVIRKKAGKTGYYSDFRVEIHSYRLSMTLIKKSQSRKKGKFLPYHFRLRLRR